MKIDPSVHLVGSGQFGFDMTDRFDCNVYLFDSGDSFVLFDAGTGMGTEEILDLCRRDGVELSKIRHLFLTHAHTDHAGGAASVRDRLGVTTYASSLTAKMVTTGDEDAVSLTGARAGGIYPRDYRYRPCAVDHVLDDEEVVGISNLAIESIATPGHSHDHCSYLVTTPEKRYLVAGDAIFFGGKIVLQNSYDCSVPDSIASIERLSRHTFDALLPGHLAFSLKNGMRHVQAAMDVIARFGCPQSLL